MSELKFLNSYFEDEVRDGFFIPSEIKRSWAAELEVLNEVDKICRRHNISYFADWGTLLAAVRHEGYIPWDDDLDIVMKRKDYERFMKIAAKELPDGFSAYNFHNHEDFWLFLGRVVGKQRICFEEEHLQRFHQFPYIAGVDIFVLDYVCRDEEKEQKRNRQAMSAIALADAIGENKYDQNHINLLLGKLENEINTRIDRALTGDALRRELYSVAEKLFAKFTEEEADELTQLYPFGLKNNTFRFPKECYDRAVRIPYENTTVPVPELYGKMLSMRYGEYMNLVRNVSGHDYPFFALQHQQLLSVLDFELPEYRYEEDKIGRSNIEKSSGTFKSVVSEYCDAIKEVCSKIESLSVSAQAQTTDEIQSLCEETQQLAIDLGSFIERFRGEGFVTVGYLEQLCSAVYFIYENAGDAINVRNMMDSCNAVCESAKKDIISRKEVVFMPDHPKHWEGFDAIYRAAVKDPLCDVYVIPIPYYYKNYDGSIHDRQYNIEDYPHYVTIISYEKYEFELCRPNIIFIQNPYDEWNVSVTVPEYFYSRNLLKYTDKLVYIPWFYLEEFTTANDREYYNMKYYCTVPGVVNADVVVVQSEKMRNNYIQKLTEWSGEQAKCIWEKKILSVDDMEVTKEADNISNQEKKNITDETYEDVKNVNDMNNINNHEDTHEKYNTETGNTKSIIYYIQLSSFLEYREKMLDKLQASLDIFRDSGILMIWIMEEQAEKDMKRLAPEIYDGYLKKKDYCINHVGKFVLRSNENSCSELIENADAYYGDRGRIALEFEVAKKPVMIQDVNILH